MAKRKRAVLGASATVKEPSEDFLDNSNAIPRFFQTVVEHVLYSDFIDLEPPLAVDLFLKLRSLTILDRYFQLEDESILARMGIAQEHLDRLRAHPHYPPVLEAVKEKTSKLAKPRSMDDWAQEAQDRMASEMFLVALSDAGPRDRVPAIEAFLDRTSAKKGREAEKPAGMMFPDDALKIMKFALEMGQGQEPKQIGSGSTVDIAADVLNVPKPTKRLQGPPEEPEGAIDG